MKINNNYYKSVAILAFMLFAKTVFSQNVGISSSNSFTPDASAALDVSYTSKGLLIPRVALTASNAAGPISSPATSLLVYNTVAAGTSPNNVIPGYYYWNGTMWIMLSTSTQTANAWSTTGNTGTSYPTNYFGTTDNFGLHFKTAATHRLWIDSLGSVAVGISPVFSTGAAREKFLVDAGSVSYPTPTGAFNVISGKGYLDSYLQLNIQNTSPTAAASSDIVASNDQATENTNYIDMGINSSGNTSTGVLGGASTAYLLATGNDFAVGNGALNKNLLFFTAGTTSPATNTERMRIDPSGNVGIGNIAPTQKLDITGNLRFSGALMPNNNAGTAGYFLQSSGAGASPTWFNANSLVTTQAWGLTGNTGLNAGTNFIGTTDAVDFVVRTNNAERARITSAGNVGIGTTAPGQKLDVNGSINAANSIYVDGANSNTGTLNPGLYFGGSSSGEVISSKRTSGTDQYGIDFYTASNNRMTIGSTGNVGIGTITPSTKLHVFGANPLTLSGVADGTNTTADSLLTITSGLVRKLPLSAFATSGNNWLTTGNAGTTAGTNFIGTTDAIDFVVKTNNAERLKINGTTGDVSIGGTALNTSNPEQLLVDAGNTTSFNVISGKGNINSYLQLNIQNTNNGTGASSDVVASNSTATESTNYIDMGVNSTANNTTGVLGGSNTAYLLATGNDFAIGNGSSGKNLLFFTGGTGNNERMRVDGNGNVGIGTTSPTQKLDVNGSINAASSVYVDGGGTNNSTITPGVVFGGPSSGEGIASNRSSGTNQNGLDFYTAFSRRMVIANGGNVGINVGTPTSTLAVNGSIAVTASTRTNTTVDLKITDYIVINTSTSNTPTYNLPSASTCVGRMYRIINHGTNTITVTPAVINGNGATINSVVTTVGSNVLEVVSDGSNWRKINN